MCIRIVLHRDDRKVVKHVLMQLYLRVPHSLSLIERDPAYQLTSVSQSREGTCQVSNLNRMFLSLEYLEREFVQNVIFQSR